MQLILAKELNELYVDYFNNFLTVEGFADYYGYSDFFARKIINSGRKINHNQALLDLIYEG